MSTTIRIRYSVFQFAIQKYEDYNLACCFISMWNLVSSKESTKGEGVREEGVEPKREEVTTTREIFNNKEFFLIFYLHQIWVVTSEDGTE
jgi:hypothetical protein